jgi:dTMP kinase
MKHGKLITFEGIEGCGKSTQIQKIAGWLKAHNISFRLTREPGATAVGQQIRQILLSEKTGTLDPLTEVMLYLADRFEHIHRVIRPHLQAGDLVLSDRYHDSTVAYQGYARGISLELLDQIWMNSGIALIPELTILFDVDPEIGIGRSLEKLKQAGLDESRFEKESIDFHSRVRAGFLDLAKRNPQRYRIIDGSQRIDLVYKEVIEIFNNDVLEGTRK